MNTLIDKPRSALLASALLMLAGQVVYILTTVVHTGGEANNHPAIFADYAHDGMWTLVHIGQFSGVAILLAGLAGLAVALEEAGSAARWLGRTGALGAAASLALYGVLQAVDGVALKQVVTAWTVAPDAERAARFAVAEAVRWLEWGMRSYFDLAFGLTLLMFAAALIRSRTVHAGIPVLMSITAIASLAQGWLAGSVGFTGAHSTAIIIAWISSIVWMGWLAWSAVRLPATDGSSSKLAPQASAA